MLRSLAASVIHSNPALKLRSLTLMLSGGGGIAWDIQPREAAPGHIIRSAGFMPRLISGRLITWFSLQNRELKHSGR